MTENSDSSDQQRTHLQDLRRQISDTIPYINDDLELKARMRRWMSESYDIPSGSVGGHVEKRISQMEAEYKMQNHDGVASGSDAFPDACKGCPAYGSGCPIATHPTPQQELERISEETDADEEYKLKVRRLARDFECHRIPEFIEEFEETYVGKIRRGNELLERTDVQIHDSVTNGPTERVAVDYEESDA